MKNFKGRFALLLLMLSWITLFFITGQKSPWNYFGGEKKDNDIVFSLGDVANENYDRMGFTRGLVKFSPLNNSWLVGTERGEVFLVDENGKQVWKRSLGMGKFMAMELSRDGKIVYIGEQSPTGQLFAIDALTGDVLWKYETSRAVGADVAKRSLPSVVHISIDKEDRVFINVYRFVMSKDGSKGYSAKSLAFTQTGELLWEYPKNEPMDTWINWIDANGAEDTVAISTSAYEMVSDMKYKDTLYFINKKTGEERNSIYIEPTPPFDKTVMRGSPNFAEDGSVLAGSCSDGRAYLFDYKGNILWERVLSAPQLIDDAWLNASGRDGYVIGDKVFFSTINTFNRENWQLPTPVDHPASNSVFAFDKKGDFLYRYKALGTIEELSFAKGLIACAIGRNVRNHNYGAHGAVVLKADDGTVQAQFSTDGPLQAIDISADGNSIAGVEAPALTPEGKIIGAYRFHIWKL